MLFKQLIQKYGVPKLVKTDKRISFWNGIQNDSSISVVLNDLGSEVLTSSCATFNPNVKRSFKTMQTRFVEYFAFHDIKTFDDVNNIANELIFFTIRLIKTYYK